MTIRTGKSGRYRYYVCASCAQKGKTACKGRSVPMDRLDEAVMERISDQLLTPERVGALLRGLMDRQTRKDDDLTSRLSALRAKLSDAEARLGRMYQAIENGIANPTDPTLKDRVAAIKTERDIAQAAFDRAVAEMRPEARISEDKIAAFVEVMRQNVLTGDTSFRRAYLRAVIPSSTKSGGIWVDLQCLIESDQWVRSKNVWGCVVTRDSASGCCIAGSASI
jgi:site-specific DNA recombinase